VASDGKPCSACTEDIELEKEIKELEDQIEKMHTKRRALRTVMNENHDQLIQIPA
jgi:Mg2+ and Co2+ transporter CorA